MVFPVATPALGVMPNGDPATRLRLMVSPEEALNLVLETAVPLTPRIVPLSEACGLQLAQDLRADRDYPPFPRAMMDGYAVRATDGGRTVRIVGELAAGDGNRLEVSSGTCLEIMTGAPCPPSADAVVPKECAERCGTMVVLPAIISPGSHIAPQASECLADTVVMRAGETVTPLGVAVMASFGLSAVRVLARPALAILTTGSELVPVGQHAAQHQIRDSNGPMLLAMAQQMGIRNVVHLQANDSVSTLRTALDRVADADIVLITGGVSAGKYDLVPQVLLNAGAELVFHKVRQKPGKPLLFARRERQLFFGLPGNPLACHLGFSRYVAAALRRLEGRPPVPEPLPGRLTSAVAYHGNRTSFVLARADRAVNLPHQAWQVTPLGGVSSADIFRPAAANCYVTVPPDVDEIPAGTCLPFAWVPGSEG